MSKGMKKITLILMMLIIFTAGYCMGKGSSRELASESVTFYGKVTAIASDSIQVEGLAVNDINYRGAFDLYVDQNTKVKWRGTELSLSDLKEGNIVSITFTGEVLESYPAKIQKTEQICVLDDEL